jgi:hypothetical protein
MEASDIEKRFAYHAPDPEKIEKHEHVRSECRKLAYYLNELLPEGREKSLVVTHLEDVMMWANAAIART